MNRRWLHKPTYSQAEIESLSKNLNIGSTLSTLLLQRGVTTFDEAKNFFRPSLSDLHDPFLMKNMEQAVARIKLALDRNEKILVYGDYDVDGTTAVSLVYSYLIGFYSNVAYYIPDRTSEGYGVSKAGILWAEQNGYSLIPLCINMCLVQ